MYELYHILQHHFGFGLRETRNGFLLSSEDATVARERVIKGSVANQMTSIKRV